MNTIDSESFDKIIEDIKENNLSKSKYPKLILGTGLSITYDLPGMWKLSKRLEEEFEALDDEDIKKLWSSKKTRIFRKGLEEGLADINIHNEKEKEFVQKIKVYTAKYILEEEIGLMDNIMSKRTGFQKLLKYLKNSSSVNNPVLDIMTPNYDRVVEFVSDSLEINVINGFLGHNICHFKDEVLKSPKSIYNKKVFSVRLFKPHGSLNWIRINDKIVCTNDNKRLLKQFDNIEIITPGTSKYEIGLTNDTFRIVRERFNEVLNNSNNYSLFVFGYGFNDEHFNTVLYNKFEDVKALIIAKELKEEVVQKALENDNLTLMYSIEENNYLVHKKTRYAITDNMWNIDVFADTLFAG